MKDNFSIQSAIYAQFRPMYPTELFTWICSLVLKYDIAWDCATGNGQVASALASRFETVYATDISENQIANAIRQPNIIYRVGAAEQTGFGDHSLDLITVAQAIHWFDFEKFYAEVKRIIKPGGILAVIGYSLLHIDEKTDDIINDFYKNIIGPYWDKERHYIEEQYQTIPFPFKEIKPPTFLMQYSWTLDQLTGYLNTWSAVQHYIKQRQQNPVDTLAASLRNIWDDNRAKQVSFPLLLRIGII